MIINKEGKLFGKVSIIDILVLIGIIVVIIGLAMRFGPAGRAVLTSSEKIQYTLRVEGVRFFTVDALERGGPVSDATTKEEMGTVVDVTAVPARGEVMMADGTVARLEIPEEYDVYITVEVDGKSNDTGFYTQGNKFLAAGSTYTINTKYAVCSCVVEDIRAL